MITMETACLAGVKAGCVLNNDCDGWQVTLCDPIWRCRSYSWLCIAEGTTESWHHAPFWRMLPMMTSYTL